MKLRSVNQREIGRGPATVLVNDLGAPYDLSHFDSGSVFTEHLQGLEIASDDWLVGINLDAQSLGGFWNAALSAGCNRLSYWVNAYGAEELSTVVQSLDMLAVDGVTPVGEWIAFDLTEATTTDGSSAEFLSGFLTSRRLQQPTSTQIPTQSEETQTSRRAVLLTELVHLSLIHI